MAGRNKAREWRTARIFTDTEAWWLFRLAAFGESIGWTFLIAGLIIKYKVVDGANWPVAIGGQIHGTLFIFYLAIAIVGGPSMRWRPVRAIVAIAASVPPYGSLVFERVEARRRGRLQLKQLSQLSTYRYVLTEKA